MHALEWSSVVRNVQSVDAITTRTWVAQLLEFFHNRIVVLLYLAAGIEFHLLTGIIRHTSQSTPIRHTIRAPHQGTRMRPVWRYQKRGMNWTQKAIILSGTSPDVQHVCHFLIVHVAVWFVHVAVL